MWYYLIEVLLICFSRKSIADDCFLGNNLLHGLLDELVFVEDVLVVKILDFVMQNGPFIVAFCVVECGGLQAVFAEGLRPVVHFLGDRLAGKIVAQHVHRLLLYLP